MWDWFLSPRDRVSAGLQARVNELVRKRPLGPEVHTRDVAEVRVFRAVRPGVPQRLKPALIITAQLVECSQELFPCDRSKNYLGAAY